MKNIALVSRLGSIVSLLLLMLALTSCQEEITRNSPALQGLKDNVLWRAIDVKATLNTNGSMTITGRTQNEILTLVTSSSNETTYILGTGNSSRAAYEIDQDGTATSYSTGPNMGDGQIKIEDYDQVNRTLTGTFRFNAENTDGNPTGSDVVNYQQGVFYKIPVIPGL